MTEASLILEAVNTLCNTLTVIALSYIAAKYGRSSNNGR